MTETRRFVVAYDWIEALSSSAKIRLMNSLVAITSINVTRASFSDSGDDGAKVHQIKSDEQLQNKLEEFAEKELLVVEELVKGGSKLPRATVSLLTRPSRRMIQVVGDERQLNEEICLKIFQLIYRELAPIYGFSGIESGINAFCFPWGSATSDDHERLRRATRLREGLVRKVHTEGKLHDVYDLNLLTGVHEQLFVGPLNLVQWSEQHPGTKSMDLGNGGKLWIVPSSQRAACRDYLVERGLLFP